MSTLFRIICGTAGTAALLGTAALAIDLLTREHDATVLLAAYGALGGILFGVYLLFYAITGKWRPNLGRGNRA